MDFLEKKMKPYYIMARVEFKNALKKISMNKNDDQAKLFEK